MPAVNLNSVIASDNCGESNITKSHVGDVTSNETCANRYVITRTYKATDSSNNMATCTQVITINDIIAPVFSSVPPNVTVQCSAIPAPGNPVATDACGGQVTITYNGQTQAAGNCTDSYTLTRRWTATDACGNTRTATQRITVQDTQKPTFTSTPANITIQCSDPVPSVGTPTATDNCDASVAITYIGQTTANTVCGGTYSLLRRWRATDNCGNTTLTTQTISVVDTQAPTFLSVPANVTIECNNSQWPFPVNPTATDNCAGNQVQVTYLGEVRTDGNCINNYFVTRTWRASDLCGNTATATQRLTVVDTQLPNFVSPPANVTVSCNNIPVAPVVTATDLCSAATVEYLGQTQSPGNCSTGYTITRTWRATDLCSNTRSHQQTIVVSGQGLQNPAEERQPAVVSALQDIEMRLAPNPAFTSANVLFNLEKAEEVTVSVTDLSGRIVHTRKFQAAAGENTHFLNLESVETGIYLVTVSTQDRRAAEKLVVLNK